MDRLLLALWSSTGSFQVIMSVLWIAIWTVVLIALIWLIYVPFHMNQVSREEDKSP